ncbi:hypothetical protein CCH79_00020924, partial [Gambusia affinis]
MQRIKNEKNILDEPDSPLEVSYTISEELPKGSLIGSIAHDLGLEAQRFISGKARIYTRDNSEYVELSRERGLLLVRERIDRETLCKQTTPCALHFQIILENPMEFFTITIQIADINDNAPMFKKNEVIFKISESAAIGATFVLEKAVDLDVGVNSVRGYELQPTNNFALKLYNNQPDKNVEMVLQRPLDREKEEQINLVLTAVDGGEPQMSDSELDRESASEYNITVTCSDEGVPSLSSSVTLTLQISDVNDNAPVFDRSSYQAYVVENNTP